jgi:tRNA nucleotidyltransferase (CCA-adding enzyme)
MKKVFLTAVPAPVHEVLRAIGVLARDMGQSTFLVGGMVRDLALGRSNIDLDIVVQGDAHDLGAAFARTTGSSIKGRTKFGTCKIESRAFGIIDLATARRETYRYPGALPDVEASDLEADLARRDFSVNAMAISLEPSGYGKLIDPFGGMADASKARLRVLHPLSFRDDPTRILRGVRFAARLGFAFERKTLALLKSCLSEGCLRAVSGKRILSEIELICLEDEVLRAFGLTDKLQILAGIDRVFAGNPLRWRRLKRLPADMERISSWTGSSFAERRLCWLSGLFLALRGRDARRLAERLDLPGREKNICLWAATELGRTEAKLSRLDAGRPYKVVRLLREVLPVGMVHLYSGSGRRGRSLIRTYLEKWRHLTPNLSGQQIMALGVKQGPKVGKMLERLLELKLQGKLSSPEDEIAYVRKRARSDR